MRLPFPDQGIIHSPVAIELCVDDEFLHISLEECQDWLKMCLIVQYGISEAVLIKMPVFLHCLNFQASLTL